MTDRSTSSADDQLAWFNAHRGELATSMGIVLTSIDLNQVTGTMPVTGNRQPYGLLHGGASAALAETLGSMHAAVSAGPEATAVGIELNCSHHSSARDGTVYGVSTPLRVGRTVSTFEIVITDEAGSRICTSRLTCVIRPARAS